MKKFLKKIIDSFIIKCLNGSSTSLPPMFAQLKIYFGPLKGMVIICNVDIKKSYWLGNHETSVQRMIKRLIKEGMVVYDIGAHWGFYSLLFSRIVGPKGRVYSFEPDPFNFRILQSNIKINNLDNVIAIQTAVTEKSGSSKFIINPQITSRGKIDNSNMNGENTITVKTISLDDFVSDNPLPDFVKLDIEGGEIAALLGMQKILLNRRTMLVIEIHENSYEDVSRILKSFNYELFFIGKNKLVSIEESNYIKSSHILAFIKQNK